MGMMNTDMSQMSSPSVASLPLSAKLNIFARDIKISHTIFALPFALLSAFIASNGWPAPGKLGLILVCMVSARSLAMASNRLLDAQLDALNPRTARRAIPAGTLSRGFYWAISWLCVITFVAAAGGFLWLYHNPWPLLLSVPVLAYLCAYPLLKRFTRLCHYYLGLALGLAPVCAWIAIRGNIAAPPLWMMGAVLCWTAGFDIIYACQDYESDVAHGVFSVPSRFGIARALWIARFTHILAIAMLVALAFSCAQLGVFFEIGIGIASTLLVIEHSVVKADDLSKVGLAFFTINGIISSLLGTLGIIDVLSGR
jgi:4-hydroxybenzoate polyprenyltransferase